MYELPEIRGIVDRTAVIDTIVAFANAFDAQDWQKVRSRLADEIDIDYSEFRSETPRRVTAEEYIKQRVENLAGLRTLHVSTNHEVTINNMPNASLHTKFIDLTRLANHRIGWIQQETIFTL